MPDTAAQAVLRFENVSVSFDEAPALRSVSFEIHEAETRVIFGAAGSGKTVLLKTALGLVRPDSGRVLAFGEDISRMTEEELNRVRSKIGMAFQEGALFDSLTIEENVAYPLLNQPAIECPPEEVRPRVQEALNFVELGHTLAKFPSELSGGMRRRAAIARAVVTSPPLLLYDSPTAGLDPITATTIIALIVKERDLSDNAAIVVTHRYQDGHLLANFRYNSDSGRLEPARDHGRKSDVGTTFMVLREGRLIFEGKQAELEASRDPYIASFVKRPG
jgi:phospholipid/cholesterol/gamma-HCH transport system ATP-binding protein